MIADRALGFIAPCLPMPAERPPAEPGWIHEIKHQGRRLMARRDGVRVLLLTRRGLDCTPRYPAIAAGVRALRCRSCLIDGQAVACGEDARSRHSGPRDILFAFDLLELNGRDLRREPIETRKSLLGRLLEDAKPPLELSEEMAAAGDAVFRYARELGFVQASRLVLSLRPLARLDHEQITTSLEQVVCIDGKSGRLRGTPRPAHRRSRTAGLEMRHLRTTTY